METILFGHISIAMAIAFIVGTACLFLYGKWKAENTELKNGYSVKKYSKLTWLNVLYQFLTGFLFLFILHEISEKLLGFSGLGKGMYHLTLSAICGAFGGQLFAFIIEKGRLMLNVRDNEIAHKDSPELDEMTPFKAVVKQKK